MPWTKFGVLASAEKAETTIAKPAKDSNFPNRRPENWSRVPRKLQAEACLKQCAREQLRNRVNLKGRVTGGRSACTNTILLINTIINYIFVDELRLRFGMSYGEDSQVAPQPELQSGARPAWDDSPPPVLTAIRPPKRPRSRRKICSLRCPFSTPPTWRPRSSLPHNPSSTSANCSAAVTGSSQAKFRQT